MVQRCDMKVLVLSLIVLPFVCYSTPASHSQDPPKAPF